MEDLVLWQGADSLWRCLVTFMLTEDADRRGVLRLPLAALSKERATEIANQERKMCLELRGHPWEERESPPATPVEWEYCVESHGGISPYKNTMPVSFKEGWEPVSMQMPASQDMSISGSNLLCFFLLRRPKVPKPAGPEKK